MNQCAHCGANHLNVLIPNSNGNLFCQRCFKTQPKREESPFDKLFAMLTPAEQKQYREDLGTYGTAGIRMTALGPTVIPVHDMLVDPKPKRKRPEPVASNPYFGV